MAMFAFVLALLSAATHAMWNLAAKRVAQNITIVWLGMAVVAGALLPFAIWHGLTWGQIYAIRPYLVATVIVHVIYTISLIKAYRDWEVSVIYPIGRGTGVLGGAIFGLGVLGEPVRVLGLVGIGLILVGITLNAADGINPKKTHVTFRTILEALWIGSLIATYLIIDAIGARQMGPLSYIVVMNLGMFSLFLPIMVVKFRRETVQALRYSKRYIAIIGVGAILSYYLILWAYKLADMTYLIALRESSIFFVCMFGVFVFKEKLSRLKLLGAFIILMGAICLKI